jgi:hypothetical protein
VQQLGLYRNHPQRDATLLKPETLSPSERPALRYAYNVKILTEEGDYYGVSLDEGDWVRGYCHKNDLAADIAMPLKAGRPHAPQSAAFAPSKPSTYRIADAGSRKVPLPRSKPPKKLATAD